MPVYKTHIVVFSDHGESFDNVFELMTVTGPVGALLTGGASEQLESEQLTLHTSEYANSMLRINTNGGYAYFTMRIELVL